MTLAHLLRRLDQLALPLNTVAPALLTTLARFVFAAVLLPYYLNSALTKFDGFGLDANAYIQILPKAMEDAGYDPSQLSFFNHLIVFAGSVGEVVFPLLLLAGLATRPAALAMIIFVLVQSIVDITGHGADATTIGAWFDRFPDAVILDQRALWITVLAIPLFLGGGPLSADRLLYRWVRKTAA